MLPFPLGWRRRVSRSLEQGAWRGGTASRLGELWALIADPVRPVRLPAAGRVVAIGGATLGGSYKTPLVIALARALAGHGRVAVVASGYAARLGGPLLVNRDLPARLVGDEAALLGRVLEPLGIPVVVGQDRSDAIRLAAAEAIRGATEAIGPTASLVLVDGLLQARPRRVHRSLLVLDADAPWGAGRCPPVGDLRARRDRLLRAADAVVLVGGDTMVVGGQATPPELDLGGMPKFRVPSRVHGAHAPDGTAVDFGTLRRARLGLWLAVARPDRILRSLAAAGVEPRVVSVEADHAHPALGIDPRTDRVDAWLTSTKCATKLGSRLGQAPVWVIDHRLEVDRALLDFVAGPPVDEPQSTSPSRRAPVDQP
jgi:tetraacyldisaccharide-1-P 4'-kinase